MDERRWWRRCHGARRERAGVDADLEGIDDLPVDVLEIPPRPPRIAAGVEGDKERAVGRVLGAGVDRGPLALTPVRGGRWNAAIDEWRKVSELRRLEPTGLVKLAEAQIHEKRWGVARQSIQKLQRSEWPARFGDVSSQARQLEAKLPKE